MSSATGNQHDKPSHSSHAQHVKPEAPQLLSSHDTITRTRLVELHQPSRAVLNANHTAVQRAH
jgi:hypothetical protein